MQEIELTKGLVAIVDDEDYEELSKHLWHVTKSGYACRYIRDLSKKKKQAYLPIHRAIMGLSSDDPRVVDHIDGDKLNNQRSNLRICTAAENVRNRRGRADVTSGFKGVYTTLYGKWRAAISHNKKWMHIGVYETREEACAAYCRVAKELHGEFANFELKKVA